MASIKTVSVPDLGGATDVTVIEVLVKVGDNIQVDTPIVTLESDKATMEVPTNESGQVEKIQVKVGDHVSTGDVLLTVSTSTEAASKEAASKGAESIAAEGKAPSSRGTEKAKPISPVETKAPETTKEAAIPKETPGASQPDLKKTTAQKGPAVPVLTGTLQTQHADIHAGPGVRRFARELGVDLGIVSGTGPKQRVLKEDVQAYVKAQLTQAPLPATFPSMPAVDFSQFGPIEMRALSRIKKISGRNLQRAWASVPHVTQFGEADITALEEFRQAQKQGLDKQQIKLTPLVFIMKAVVASLKAFPHFNASLHPNGEELVLKKYFHIGVAVDTPDGLVVPVLRHVDQKGLIELAQELGNVSEKARRKQLAPGDMQGGCFSISSLGGIGGTAFTPIINYPEVAILGVSKSYFRPVFQEGTFVPRYMLPLSLSYDHRVVDGADGARFMVHLTDVLSDIRHLLL